MWHWIPACAGMNGGRGMLATGCRGCDIPARRKCATDRLAPIELAAARADPDPAANVGSDHGTVGYLHRLLARRASTHDHDRAVDRSLLFGGDQLADIALPLLHDVLGGLEGGRPPHRAEG